MCAGRPEGHPDVPYANIDDAEVQKFAREFAPFGINNMRDYTHVVPLIVEATSCPHDQDFHAGLAVRLRLVPR